MYLPIYSHRVSQEDKPICDVFCVSANNQILLFVFYIYLRLEWLKTVFIILSYYIPTHFGKQFKKKS